MTSEPNFQLKMPLNVAVEVPSFELIDRENYGITEELLQLFKGNKSYILQWAAYGLISSEIPRRRLGLPDIGVPHEIVIGMTEAEMLAAYSSIGKVKRNFSRILKLQRPSEEEVISALVKEGFHSNIQALRQATEITGDHGYDTKRGGLVRRMQYLFNTDAQLRKDFSNSALSSIVANEEDRQHIWRLGFEDLADYLKNGFMAKYQMSQRNQ